MRHYETILAPHGVSLAFPDDLEQSLPLDVSGRLRGGRFDVPGDISSQYLTGLLMALPLTGSAANIVLTSPLESKSYIDLTCQVMAHYGVDVFYEESSERYAHGAYRIAGNQMYGLPNEPTSEPMAIERDYSQAAFWLVAQALGQPIEIANLDPDSLQGDRAVLAIIDHLRTHTGTETDLSNCPDLMPALAPLAMSLPGSHRFVNAGATVERSEHAAVGSFGHSVSADEQADEFVICGGTIRGGRCSCAGDHRFAMALAFRCIKRRRCSARRLHLANVSDVLGGISEQAKSAADAVIRFTRRRRYPAIRGRKSFCRWQAAHPADLKEKRVCRSQCLPRRP